MNGNQVDSIIPQAFDVQSEQTEVACIKKYMVVDPKGEILGLTRDKHLASSVKQVHQFVMTHFAQLTAEEIDLLSSNNLEQTFKANKGLLGTVSKAKKGLLGSLSKAKKNLSKKINTAIEFVVNLGKTEKTLIKEIQTKVMNEHKICENMVNDFNRELERDGLKEKLETILIFKNKLENAESQFNKYIDFLCEEQAEGVAREVDEIKKELLIQQEMIRPKKVRKHIKCLLKQINISENDSCMVQEAKKRFLREHEVFIKIMELPHIQFNSTSEVKLFFTESRQSSKRLKIDTNFSDRAMEGVNCHFRAPEDSSVEKAVQPYIESFSLRSPTDAYVERLIQSYKDATSPTNQETR